MLFDVVTSTTDSSRRIKINNTLANIAGTIVCGYRLRITVIQQFFVNQASIVPQSA